MLNYGGIGFSVGHELSHAFDDNGRKYNGRGDLEPWWSAATLRRYSEHTECLVRQYGAMSVAGRSVNGRYGPGMAAMWRGEASQHAENTSDRCPTCIV